MKSTLLALARRGLRNGEGPMAKQHGACLKFQHLEYEGRRLRNSRSFFYTLWVWGCPTLIKKKKTEQRNQSKQTHTKQTRTTTKMSTLNSGSWNDSLWHPAQLFTYPLNVLPGSALVFLLLKIPRTTSNLLCSGCKFLEKYSLVSLRLHLWSNPTENTHVAVSQASQTNYTSRNMN